MACTRLPSLNRSPCDHRFFAAPFEFITHSNRDWLQNLCRLPRDRLHLTTLPRTALALASLCYNPSDNLRPPAWRQ
ncbi:hypothetical protein CBOM_08066 [Ceraceosorus bombacis]|uniref:Uncharacterized protein n=1 Tax=Ceraceosorus bombacis TaxID=401625 RepID=A0A0P1BC48_9BASI|nr:hypothetical protein CBOM_08066 [Ceraceosorus bombacis]